MYWKLHCVSTISNTLPWIWYMHIRGERTRIQDSHLKPIAVLFVSCRYIFNISYTNYSWHLGIYNTRTYFMFTIYKLYPITKELRQNSVNHKIRTFSGPKPKQLPQFHSFRFIKSVNVSAKYPLHLWMKTRLSVNQPLYIHYPRRWSGEITISKTPSGQSIHNNYLLMDSLCLKSMSNPVQRW